MAVYAPAGPAIASGSPRQRLRSVFVGRDRQLTRILDAVGQPDLAGIALSGDQGTGKTRLITEAVRRLDPGRFRVVPADAAHAVDQVPFSAFAEHLPPALVTSPPDRYALDVAAQTLVRLAGDRRLVLAVDGLTRLDDASLGLAAHLAGTRTGLLIATVGHGVPLPERVDALWSAAGAEWIEVPPLTRLDVADLLTATLDGQIEGLLVQRWWEMTGGNPALLCELVAAQLDADRLALDAGLWRMTGPLAVAPRLVRLVEERLRRLPGQARYAAELVAFGEPVSTDALLSVVPHGALEAAESQGVIRVEQHEDGGYARLAYPLFGEVLRRSTPWLRAQRRQADLARLRQVPTAPSDERAYQTGRSAAPVDATGYELALAGRAAEAEGCLARLGQPGTDGERARLATLRAVSRFLGSGLVGEAPVLVRSALAETAEPGTRGELAALDAVLATVDGRVPDGLSGARAVLADPDATPVATIRARVAEGLALVFLDRPAEGARVLAGVGRDTDASDAELPWLALPVEIGLVHAGLWTGDVDGAHERARQGYTQALTTHRCAAISVSCLSLALVAQVRGAVDEQVSWCREGLANARDHGPAALLPALSATLAQGLVAAGEPAAARAVLEESDRSRVDGFGLLRPWTDLARVGLDEDRKRGVAAAGRTAARARRAGAAGFEAMAWFELVRLGEPERAAGPLADLAGRSGSEVIRLYAVHARAAAEHDADDAGTVSAGWERLGRVRLAAEAAAEQSRWYRATERLGLASGALARAMSLARRCTGAVGLPALQRLDPPRLTRRESEVAGLAAQGLSSREIGARFYLSVRTVDNHLRRVYRKLGIGSRAELAELRGLFPDDTDGGAVNRRR